jgi:tetratricopeptide (TPR) repeat protein
MSFLKKLFIKDPQDIFSNGRKAFDQGDYIKAAQLFEKSYKKFNEAEMRVISIDNAAISAEYAEKYEVSQELYFRTICTKLQTGQKPQKIIPDIDKTLQIGRLCKKPAISQNKLNLIKFLIFLSQKQFDKLSSFFQKLKFDSTDQYSQAIEKIWGLIHLASTFENSEKLPQMELPEEFNNILEDAEHVMQRCSLCDIILKVDEQSENPRKGTEFNLEVTITAHAPISIKKINLKTGTKGRIITTTIPELPLNLSTGENYSILFSLIPNLPGEWILGPLSLNYSIPEEHGEYPSLSKITTIKIDDATPAVKISMESETIEEDMEYLLTVYAENIGKTGIQNIKIAIELPNGVEI